MKILLHPTDDAEALLFEKLLLDNDIPVEVISYHDTAYNGIYQMQKGWGVIKVTETDFEKANAIITQWKNATIEEISDEYSGVDDGENHIKVKSRPFLPLYLYVALIISLVINVYFFIDYISYYVATKDFVQKSYDENGNIIAEYDYSKHKEYPHLMNFYSKKGEKFSTHFDNDSDGWTERIEEYSSNITWTYLDENENGIFEKQFGTNQNGLLITYNDSNEDKIFETMTIRNDKGDIIVKCYDNNADNIFEEIISFSQKTKPKTYRINLENYNN